MNNLSTPDPILVCEDANISQTQDSPSSALGKTNRHKLWLFLVVSVLFCLWLIPQGTMIDVSADAASIWATIKSFYSDSIQSSYVLYKGFLSVFPYVWFYQLSLLFETNEFLFVMIYHALLFSYITTIGIPSLATHFFKREIKLWQNITLVVWLFLIWEPTYALDQLMVDLPSCAFLLLAIQLAQKTFELDGWQRIFSIFFAASFSGMVCVISGQYVLAGICVLLYMVLKLRPWKLFEKTPTRVVTLLCLVSLLISFAWPYVARNSFDQTVVQPLREQGEWIPAGDAWMERALVRGTGFSLRAGQTPRLITPRGYQILVDYYGSEEIAAAKLNSAEQGVFGWNPSEWFSVFTKYPFDFLVLMMDKLFIMLSITQANNNFYTLVIGYVLLFIAMYAFAKQFQKIDSVFNPEFILVLAPIVSILPNLVMGIEMRFTLSLHSLVYGFAILGPTVSEIWAYAKDIISPRREDGAFSLRSKHFPWPLILCILFIMLCNSHIGALYSQSNAAMLFTW